MAGLRMVWRCRTVLNEIFHGSWAMLGPLLAV